MKSALGGMSDSTYLDDGVSPPGRRYFSDYLEIFLVLLMATAAFLAFSLLLPDVLASATQQYIGWGFSCAVGLLSLLVMVQSLKNLPDR